MRPRSVVLAFLAIAIQAGSAEAQTTYARSAKDTLRFREVAHSEVRMTMPQGEVSVPIDNSATIAVVLLPGDSARAWYDSLSVTVSSPAGMMTPSTTSLLKQPFLLKVDSRGRTNLVTAPLIPGELEGITDLTHQFDDFFMRLPATALRIGMTWTDTATRNDTTNGKSMKSTTIGNYKVERDTTADGEAAMVISVKQNVTLNVDAPIPGQDMRVQSSLTGGDEGFYVFAPKSGRMIGRQRKGQMSGEAVMSGAMGSMTMQQVMSYTSKMDAVK